MNFDVVQGDITNIAVDAIVLPANEKLKEGSGSSRAIFEKAGRKELTKACHDIGLCKVGDAVPTLAFKLNVDYIIHAVVPKWIDGEHQEYDYLSAAYLSALNVADVMECKSIAFPLLAAENNGFNLGLAYDIAKSSIESFEGKSLNKVMLVVYGDNIATFMRGKGVVINVEKKEELQLRENGLGREGKVIVTKLFEEQIAKAFEYLKDAENREKVVNAGIKVAKVVISMVTKKKIR